MPIKAKLYIYKIEGEFEMNNEKLKGCRINIVYRNIKELKPYKKNAKKHPKEQIEQIEQIANSIKEFGFTQS